MSEDRCVICGEIVPEGRQVCPKCERSTGRAKRVCYGCGEREIGCHAYCPRYAEENARNSERLDEHLRQADILSYQIGAYRKKQRRKMK